MPFFRASGGAGGAACLARLEDAVSSLGEHEIVLLDGNNNVKVNVYAGQTTNLPTPLPTAFCLIIDPSKLPDCSSIKYTVGSDTVMTAFNKDGTLQSKTGNGSFSLVNKDLLIFMLTLSNTGFVMKFTGVAPT